MKEFIENIPPVIISLLRYLGVINVILFAMMGFDKKCAIKGKSRTPEKVLLMSAFAGGAIGGIIGMIVFHHKVRKPAFFIGFPAALVLDALILYWLIPRII